LLGTVRLKKRGRYDEAKMKEYLQKTGDFSELDF
jgi:hypothetical protein